MHNALTDKSERVIRVLFNNDLPNMYTFYEDSRDGVVNVSTRQRTGWSGVRILAGEIFFSLKFTEQLWGTVCLLFSG